MAHIFNFPHLNIGGGSSVAQTGLDTDIAQREEELRNFKKSDGTPLYTEEQVQSDQTLRALRAEKEAVDKAEQEAHWKTAEGTNPLLPGTTAGGGWSMGKYAPTQVVQKELMPQRILPREEEEVYGRGSLFGMNPYRWYS